MKRLNHHLLTRYPLLWNMRIHWVLPLLLLLHFLFYCAGLAESHQLSRLNYGVTNFQAGASSLAVLVGLLVIIGWLAFYLRNNAFKSLYPVGNSSLFIEFLLALLIIGLSSTLSLSHQAGRFQRLRNLTADINLAKEVNSTTLAFHFLPFNESQFEIYNSCDSVRLRDSLMAIEDAGYTQTDRVTAYDTDTSVERSYLHYCGLAPISHTESGMLSKWEADAIAKRWLWAGRRDSVEAVLQEYLGLVKKYGGSFRFNAEHHVAEIFSTPRFLVQSSLRQYDDANYGIPYLFITTHKVEEALRAIQVVRGGVLSKELSLLYLYWVAGGALLLFTFRITRLPTWFGAGVGLGIWLIIFAVLATLTQNEGVVILGYLLVTATSAFYATAFISQRRRKTSSGYAFLWSVWSMLFFVPVLVLYIRGLLRRQEYEYDGAGNLIRYEVSPAATWIDQNMVNISLLNLLLLLMIVAWYAIPLARRWQASPEE